MIKNYLITNQALQLAVEFLTKSGMSCKQIGEECPSITRQLVAKITRGYIVQRQPDECLRQVLKLMKRKQETAMRLQQHNLVNQINKQFYEILMILIQ